MARKKDFQKSRVYRAEWDSEIESRVKQFQSISEIQSYLDSLFQKGLTPKVLVEKARGKRNSIGFHSRALIRLLPVHYNKFIVLHEVSHILTKDSHGPKFCGVLLSLVREEISEEFTPLLKHFLSKRIRISRLYSKKELRIIVETVTEHLRPKTTREKVAAKISQIQRKEERE